MKSLVFGLVLTVAGVSAAADANFSFILDNTKGQVLPVGKYYWFHMENGLPVVTEIITKPFTPVEPDDPDDPDDPPVDDTAQRVSDLFAAVTLDPDKKATAGKISGLCDLLLAQIEAGTVKEVAVLRKDVGAIVPVLTLMGKAAAWKPFTDGVTSMTATASFETCVGVLKAVSAVLKKA